MSRGLISFFFLLLIISNAISQELTKGSISGTIQEEVSDNPIPGVIVSWVKEGKPIASSLTDAEGKFHINGIDSGIQSIELRMIGYKTRSSEVRVISGTRQELTINLKGMVHDILSVEIIGSNENTSRRIPGGVTLIDPKKIELTRPAGTQELLEKVSGINGFSDDGAGNSRMSIGIRGLDPRRSSKVLILEDGIPIQPALYIYPNVYYNPPVERVEKIEIIKGSGTVKYGPQTMGGVINYITKRPRSEFGGQTQLTYGNNNYFCLYSETGGFGNDKIHPELQLLYKSGDGFRDYNDFRQINTTLKLNIINSLKSNLYIKANYNNEVSQATYTGLTEYSFNTNPRFNSKANDEFTVQRYSIDLIFNQKHNRNLFSSTKAYVNYFNRTWWREKDIFIEPKDIGSDSLIAMPWFYEGDLVRYAGGKGNFGNLRKFYVFGVERNYNLHHQQGEIKGNLEFGGRFYKDRFIDDKKSGNSPTDREGVFYRTEPDGSNTILGQSHHYETTALSFFILETLNAGKFSFRPGCRFEGFEQEKIDLLNGSLYQDRSTLVVLPGAGLNYEFSNSNIFGGIHRGFSPPSSGTLNILNFGTGSSGIDLRAEKSWNSELGFRHNQNLLDFQATVFHLLIEDLVTPGRGTIFTNLGKARTYGIENDLTLYFSKLKNYGKFLPDFYMNYTYLKTEIISGMIPSSQSTEIIDVKGNQLPYAPNTTYLAGLSKSIKNIFSIYVEMKFTDWVYTDFENIPNIENRGDQGVVPKYTLYNAGVIVNFKKNWEIIFSGKNILDTIYIGSRLHSNPGQTDPNQSSGIMPGARRQLNLSLKYKFGKSNF